MQLVRRLQLPRRLDVAYNELTANIGWEVMELL